MSLRTGFPSPFHSASRWSPQAPFLPSRRISMDLGSSARQGTQQEERRARCSLCVFFFQSESSFSRHRHSLESHESEPSLMPNLSQPLAKGIKDVTRVGDRRERHNNENQGFVSMEGSEMPIQLSTNNVSPTPRYPPSPG